ncbi:hypothetical protein, partial [Mesorhizobium sp. M1E.F.Ca.ET.063.01.1.1]|uniref:hypothetical protein n=1 Tax=Mesorhizobium sp. M1E.F.Ca.ET.063.01.1.1 TaxID=2496750 RepID=UPI001AEC800F
IWLGAVAQAESASSMETATILLKLDLRIGRRIGRNHKRSLASFLNAGRRQVVLGDINISTICVVFLSNDFEKCRLG